MTTLLLICALLLVAGMFFERIWLLSTVIASALGLSAAIQIFAGANDWEWWSAFSLAGEPVHLRLDGLSALFVALLSVVGGAGAVYAQEYWPERRSRAWWSGILLSMGFVLVASNGLAFLIAWELFTVCAYFLITLDRKSNAARGAGWLFLAASHAGAVCLFAFFSALAARTGSWDLGPMRDQAALAPLFWLAFAGFSVKAGLFPLHVWLPSAHANAPSHVSAIMSGVAIKMGVYGILRFSGWLPIPSSAGWVAIALGALSAVLGIAFAFAQNDFKRLLAYCSVENIGIIITGIGASWLGLAHGQTAWARLALAGALLHIWNHGAFKALLFFGAGSVLHATGTREISRLGGLWRAMPWTAPLFALGSLAVSGLPPLNGFVSEWLVYLGLLDAAMSRSPAAWAAMPAIILVAMAGALALASFVKATTLMFLGAPRSKPAAHAHECGPRMRGSMAVLATLCVLLGLAPVVFWPAVARALGSWNPVWTDLAAPAPLATISSTQITLAILLVAAAALLWRKAKHSGVDRRLTWDCGYATPTRRMQYTGGSFAGIIAGWFAWAFRADRTLRRPRGIFPDESLRLERVPETVLERVITPVSNAVLEVSNAVRQLQHGALRFYILYVVGGLIAVGALVAFGGTP